MTSSLARYSTRQPRRSNARFASILLTLAAVFMLAACGTTNVAAPPEEYGELLADDPTEEFGELPVDDPTEELGELPADDPSLEPTIVTFVSEAETLAVDDAFVVELDDLASQGRYLVQPASVGAASSGYPVLEVAFELAAPGEHTLWARVFAPSLDSDATYLGFNGATHRVFAPELGRYVWLEVVSEALDAGRNVISVGHGEPRLRIDLLVVTKNTDVPMGVLEALVADGPSDPEPSEPPDHSPRAGLSLDGVEAFDRSSLTTEQQLWYDRTWNAIRNSSADMVRAASTDNSYRYGRDLYLYNQALLMNLRSTGNLEFLDEVDRVMQALRSQLRDGWDTSVAGSLYVNSSYGTVSEPDGYVNFRWRDGSTHRNNGRDTGDLDETLTHGHLAMVMYAYDLNRNRVSPSGLDYGERADFWYDYLRNHFEAKWRGRSGVSWPEMDFIDLKFNHTYHVFILYYYFMGKKLLDDGNPEGAMYLAYAEELTDKMFEQQYVPGTSVGGFIETSGAYGDAVVYPVAAPDGQSSYSEIHLQALPMTYSRYMLAAIMTLHLEGLDGWDDAIMMKLSNGITSFVFETERVTSTSEAFAAGNSGSSTVEGMPPTTYRSRMSVGKFSATLIPGFAVWDASDRIERVSLDVYAVMNSNLASPRSVYIPSSMLFVESATLRTLGMTASR